MRALRLTARGFRNLAPLELSLPVGGAVLLGPNGHGKTSLLEAIYYPVIFRSMRGAPDAEVVASGEQAFHLSLTVRGPGEVERVVEAGFAHEGRRKLVRVDGAEQERVSDAMGVWLAVAFQPSDVGLISGGARERRRYLDRVLSLADRAYLTAARRYRAALEQRNAALRRGRANDAAAFDAALAVAGATLIRERTAWVAEWGPEVARTCDALGEPMAVTVDYRGIGALADPAAWPEVLADARARDRAARSTTVGPHRDDLTLRLNGALLRDLGSTGQQRTAAIALKLCEHGTLAARTGRKPALLLDDVFAELDRARQELLAATLAVPERGQVVVTAPRRDELPAGLGLPVFAVRDGRVVQDPERALA